MMVSLVHIIDEIIRISSTAVAPFDSDIYLILFRVDAWELSINTKQGHIASNIQIRFVFSAGINIIGQSSLMTKIYESWTYCMTNSAELMKTRAINAVLFRVSYNIEYIMLGFIFFIYSWFSYSNKLRGLIFLSIVIHF